MCVCGTHLMMDQILNKGNKQTEKRVEIINQCVCVCLVLTGCATNEWREYSNNEKLTVKCENFFVLRMTD